MVFKISRKVRNNFKKLTIYFGPIPAEGLDIAPKLSDDPPSDLETSCKISSKSAMAFKRY